MTFLCLWCISGFIGYLLYCTNSRTRPKKIHLLIFSFLTHVFMGPIGLFYGYVCATGLKEKESAIEDPPQIENESNKEEDSGHYWVVRNENSESTPYCSTVYIDCSKFGRDKSFYIAMNQPKTEYIPKHLPIRKGDYRGKR